LIKLVCIFQVHSSHMVNYMSRCQEYEADLHLLLFWIEEFKMSFTVKYLIYMNGIYKNHLKIIQKLFDGSSFHKS